jgi:hypothetical protein
VTGAALNGEQLLTMPDGVLPPTTGMPFTLDTNEELVIQEIAKAVLGTAAASAGAILDMSFAERENVLTTNVAVNPCFCSGTHVLTTRGDIAVEELRAGDAVITYHGEEQKSSGPCGAS